MALGSSYLGFELLEFEGLLRLLRVYCDLGVKGLGWSVFFEAVGSFQLEGFGLLGAFFKFV